jgi:hypothetical protein
MHGKRQRSGVPPRHPVVLADCLLCVKHGSWQYTRPGWTDPDPSLQQVIDADVRQVANVLQWDWAHSTTTTAAGLCGWRNGLQQQEATAAVERARNNSDSGGHQGQLPPHAYAYEVNINQLLQARLVCCC